MLLLLFFIVGIVSGLLTGLLGVGGGIITVPCLLYLFKTFNIETIDLMQICLGTSLACVIVNTFSSSIAHIKAKNILQDPIKKLTLYSVLGAFSGSLFVGIFPSDVLQILFGIFEIIIGLIFFFQKHYEHNTEHRLPKGLRLFFIIFSVSFLASILGIGGGIFMIPILIYYFVPMKKAIGTTAITSFATSVTASISFIILGYKSIDIPYSLGFIYLPAFFPIGLAGFIMAPIGVKLGLKLPTVKIKKIFAFLMFIIGVFLIIK